MNWYEDKSRAQISAKLYNPSRTRLTQLFCHLYVYWNYPLLERAIAQQIISYQI